MSSNENDLPIDVALYAAKMGFPVFPTNPRTKKPFVTEWQNVATRDPEAIRRFWTKFSNAMVGVVTGHASGYFVLDVDVEEGEDAFKKLRALEKVMGEIPATLTVKTPSGGLHLYFTMPADMDIRNSAGKLGAKIDIRANGGYVIFPGSIRADGQSYQIINRGE